MEGAGTFFHLSKWIFVVIMLFICGVTNAGEICNGQEFKGQCSRSEVIMINSALYGRMKLGECVKNDFGHLGCKSDVMGLMDKLCSGKQQCTVQMDTRNRELMAANTGCVAGLLLYMDIDYTCINVAAPKGQRCTPGTTTKLVNPSGYISSHVTQQTGCGSPGAPWVIDARPGQTVELWLIDFGALGRRQDALYTTCTQTLGFVTEKVLGVNMTICGGKERRKLVYTSKTNSVEIHLVSRSDADFVLEYKLVGCPELSPPAHAWYKRQGNEAMIGCKSDNRKWKLHCNGASWEGSYGNCTDQVEIPKSVESETTKDVELTFSSIIVLTGVVCGAALLVIIVVVAGVVYIKKQKIKHEVHLHSEYGAATLPPNLFSTNKNPGYDVSTMKSAMTSSALPPGGAEDNQPLVHIWERTLPDAPGTMRQSLGSDRLTAGRSSQGDLLQ